MIACYVRVSTQEQTQGYSIDEQKARLQAYCAAMGWENPVLFVDPGYSGGNTDRPGLKSMIEGVKEHRIKTVIVYKLDRLSRSQLDTLYLIERVFLENGCQFISVTENFDTSSPFGRAMMGILAVFAQLEREQIKERMQMGLDARVKEGLWHGSGNHPTGYDYADGKLTVNVSEAVTVRDMFEMINAGETVTDILNKYPEFNRRRIRYLLENPLYAGYIRSTNGTYKGQHEPIVSDELFQAVQKIMDRSRRQTPRSGTLLAGLIWCAKCGSRYMSLSTKENDRNYRYYRCHHRCGNKAWKEEKLNNLVLEQLKNFTFEEENRKDEIKKQAENEEKALKTDLKRLLGQRDRLIQLYSNGIIEISEIQPKIAEIDEKTAKIREKIEENRKKAEFQHDLTEKMKQLPPVFCLVNLLPFEQQRSLMRDFINRIEINEDDLEIWWNF